MSLSERQRRLLYSCIVAGKSATFADGVMERLMPMICGTLNLIPLDALYPWKLCEIEATLRVARSGNYRKLAKCFHELADALKAGRLRKYTALV